MDSGILLTIGIVAFVVIISLASFIPMIFIFGRFFKRQAANARLMQSGESAQAQILSIQETGTRINDQPEFALVLNVTRGGQAPYQVQTTMVASFVMIPRLQPGMSVPVRIDPANPTSVAVDRSALASTPMGMPGMMPGAGMQAGMMPGAGMQAGMMPGAGMQAGMMPGAGMQAGMMPGAGMQAGMMPGAGMQAGMNPQQAMAMAQHAAMQAPAGGSIITCAQCRNPFASANPHCPNCGAPKPA